ncbi:MAG: class I tRNA ligase family protein, partial [Crenarchaeota archaeon]|nr:class I tRNA ligase family protein [Thermoproteota archaeon]
MRNEFSYFYPLDSRNSGRDLVPNHLTYFIFNHVTIFPKELWPRQIVVNGSVLMEGKKMSKSFGNIIPLKDALRNYGADPFRIAVLATAELLQDADFSSALAKALRERLERFYSFALQVIDLEENDQEKPLTAIDLWLLSRLQQRVKAVTEPMENMRFREAIHNVLYMFDQDVQWYLRRSAAHKRNKGSSNILKQVLEIRTLLLAPFAPHLCEEIWEKLGKPSFISISEWPSYDEAKIDIKVIEGEELVKTLRDDVSNIVQATKATPKKIFLYAASEWKWRIYIKTLELATEGEIKVSDLIRKLMADPELKKHARRVTAFVQKIVADVNEMPTDLVRSRLDIGVLDEIKIIKDARCFYEEEFNAEVII